MCQGCIDESGVKPVVNDDVRACAELIRELYEIHSAGGYGHIVFDDYNIEDGFIRRCIDDAIKGLYDHLYDDPEDLEVGKVAAINALKSFLLLSEPERYGALSLVDGYIK